ncbi:NADP-dependent oxidoreductase [Secundilactobacillus paracollinoides]|uniref:NADP-dependent oxidoreductase n=1 Tax=Secundilactobacillus paracollinoides TaxID=240427 RepID=UPI001CDAFEC8|nr:NADP-dependent oxidoreductase [Secundilactobacillus paracollinoides]
MKTIAINQFGTADEFHEINLDQPALTADTVAVAIHAFSINPMDIAARAGYLQSPFSDNWSFPLVLGWDFSGIITEVGQNVTQYHAGDHVFGTLASDHPGNAGSYAEATVVDPAAITKIPAGMSFDQAAALPIAAGTAYQAIVQNLKVQSNDTVLVQGGAGGVGLFAVQIAKALGAKVITTASPAHTELLQKLGIDQIIDYHTTAVADVVSTVDAVF